MSNSSSAHEPILAYPASWTSNRRCAVPYFTSAQGFSMSGSLCPHLSILDLRRFKDAWLTSFTSTLARVLQFRRSLHLRISKHANSLITVDTISQRDCEPDRDSNFIVELFFLRTCFVYFMLTLFSSSFMNVLCIRRVFSVRVMSKFISIHIVNQVPTRRGCLRCLNPSNFALRCRVTDSKFAATNTLNVGVVYFRQEIIVRV